MPKLRQDLLGGGTMLKPDKPLGLSAGDIASFEITTPHRERADTNAPNVAQNPQAAGAAAAVASRTMVSFGVKTKDVNGKEVEGFFSANAGNRTILVKVLGDDSDRWVGATFDAVVVTQQNPNTKVNVLSWQIKERTVKGPVVKGK